MADSIGKVKLQNVRLSFPDLFEAVQFEGTGPFKYRASFLMEPNSDNHKNTVKAMAAVGKEHFKDKWPVILKNLEGDSKLRFVVDGDAKTYDGYAGMMCVSATRNQDKGRPYIVDQKKQPLSVTDGKPYAGCYVNATIELWPQDNKYGKTIRATLLGVQFVKDGDAFASNSVANPDDFEELADTGEDESLVA